MKHKHKAKSEKIVGYRYPVGPASRQDERAHGGVCHIETCVCGAVRETNANGRFQEQSGWQEGAQS